MKKFLTILLLLPMIVGCTEENTLLTERDKIVKYLTSTRHMVEESELDSVIAPQPAFYNVFGRYAYRHIVNYYDADRESRPQVAWGDRLELRFTAYVFSGTEPNTSAIYWSNVPEVIEELGSKSDNTLDWSTEPLIVDLGSSKLLEGLERTLPGCYEADSVQVYMTSNLAYGKEIVGVVPKNSMVAWYMKILKVTK